MTFDAVNNLLMSGGIKSIGWKEHPVGHTVIGTICDQPKVEQMKKYQSEELDFWPSGDPKMQIVLTIQTDLRDPANSLDDGKRRLHVPPRMMQPVREAVQRAGAPGLAIGGRIAVRRIGGSGATGDPFQFAAEYAAPAVDPGSLMGGNGNGAAPAAAAPQSLGVTQQAPAASPAVSPVAQSLGITQAAPDGPPPGLGMTVEQWNALPDTQRAAIRAAMAPATSGPIPF